MKKNCIFIKDLGILEPLNYQKNGPLNCYVDFGNNATVTATIAFSCAEFDGQNYTSTIFPERKAQGGLPYYGSFDLSSSHDDIIGDTPIVDNLISNIYYLDKGTSKQPTFYVKLNINKALHVSTNSTKKIIRLRYIPLEVSDLHNGFYAGYNTGSLNYQNGLFRRDSDIIGLPYLELSFYIFEKSDSSFITYTQNTGAWTIDNTLKEIIFLRNNFISSSGKKGKLAFTSDGTGQQNIKGWRLDSEFARFQSVGLTSEVVNGITVYKVPTNQTLNTTLEIEFSSLTNALDSSSTKSQSVFVRFTNNASIWYTVSGHDILKDHIHSNIIIPTNNINIIENLISNPIKTKGNTIINCIPSIDKGNVDFIAYINESDQTAMISLSPSSSDRACLIAANIYYDVECQLKLNSKILETRKGFGNIVYAVDGSIDTNQSTGHTFSNLAESADNYQITYIFTLRNYTAY